MIAPARIALFKDAYYQVMDNWVFRILAVICAIFVLIPFIVGFREDGIVICFGLWEWSYESVLSAFGGGGGTGFQPADVRDQAISIYMDFVVQKTVGNFGVIFSIAATSFFVPQMLEKGAADVLFHKPLGRLSFYLSRYFAGVLFVILLSSVLALGTYLGFLVSSGHNDPGILMGAPLMTYVFALIFSVAMLIGVVTRSTVASILLTSLFFVGNGCVDSIWVRKTELDMQIARSGISPFEQPKSDGLEAKDASAELGDDEQEKQKEEEAHPVFNALWNVLCGFHYVLPKTGDADVMAKKLRRRINAPPFREDDSLFSLLHVPAGLETLAKKGAKPPEEFGSSEALLLGEARLLLGSSETEGGLRYTLFRRATVQSERTRKGRVLKSTENASKASQDLEDALLERMRASMSAEEAADFEIERKSKNLGRKGFNAPSGYRLVWQSAAGEGRQALVFRVGQDWIYTLLVEDKSELQSPERAIEVLEPMALELGFDISVGAYEAALSFDGPWRHNIFFSVGSSLAFVLLVLGIGWWRLTRIDF